MKVGNAILPAVRFGNIAMMPYEPVRHPSREIMVESFLVEARSLPGFSSSPVFVHILPMSLRPGQGISEGYGLWLLGVDWGHFPVKAIVKDKSGHAVCDGLWVEYNAGMVSVVPMWKLTELLDSDSLKRQRSL